MKLLHFTVTKEMLSSLLQLPPGVGISDVWEVMQEAHLGQVHVTIAGPGLPQWAEKEEGARCKSISLQYGEDNEGVYAEFIPLEES